jgi:hypothetical protein
MVINAVSSNSHTSARPTVLVLFVSQARNETNTTRPFQEHSKAGTDVLCMGLGEKPSALRFCLQRTTIIILASEARTNSMHQHLTCSIRRKSEFPNSPKTQPVSTKLPGNMWPIAIRPSLALNFNFCFGGSGFIEKDK